MTRVGVEGGEARSSWPPVVLAALAAALIIGHQIGAKATRETLFLSNFDVSLLPRMVVVAAVVSGLVTLSTTRLRVRTSPRRLTAILALLSAVLLGLLWGTSPRAPKIAAILFYLHTMVVGPLIATGFWSILNEALDPTTAKRAVGRISAGGTAGAVIGGLAVERFGALVGVHHVLLLLAGLHLVVLPVILMLPRPPAAAATETPADASESSLQTLAGDELLRVVAGLVAVTVTGAALLDYALKAEAVETFTDRASLLRFFAWYYVVVSAASFVVQVGVGSRVVERWGVARTVSLLPVACLTMGTAAALLPGIVLAVVARGSESVLRSSLFRSGYELLYTAVSPARKRAAKPLIEIVVDRSAEAFGGGLVSLFIWWAPTRAVVLCFAVASLLGLWGLWLVRRLPKGYVGALENRLADLADRPGLPAAALLAHDGTLTVDGRGGLTAYLRSGLSHEPAEPPPDDRIVFQLRDLVSPDPERTLRGLTAEGPLDPRLLPFVVPLLAREPAVRTAAAAAISGHAAAHVGLLEDVLADTRDANFAVRRRVAKLLGEVRSQRAVDALLRALEDPRFDVRLAVGRALLALHDAASGLEFDRNRIFHCIATESGRISQTTEWEMDELGPDDFVTQMVADRSERTIEHLFRLLALTLSREAIERAYRGVTGADAYVRGTALEYLENVLPIEVRKALTRVIQ